MKTALNVFVALLLTGVILAGSFFLVYGANHKILWMVYAGAIPLIAMAAGMIFSMIFTMIND